MKPLRLLLLTLGVFVVIWLGAITYWRVSGVLPDGGGMLVWLLLVPAFALVLLLLFTRWRRGRRQHEDAPPVAASDASNVDAPDLEDRVVHILGVAMQLPMASDAVAALAENAPRPALHPRIRDRDGLPVFAAFVPDLDTAVIEDALAPMEGSASPERARDGAVLRALALLEPVADALLFDAVSTMPRVAQATGTVNAGLQRQTTSEILDRLQVSLLLPSSWHEVSRAAAGEWLRTRALELGVNARQLRIDVHGVRVADDSWRFIDGLIDSATSGDGARTWHLLLACDSLVDARGIARLDAAGELLRSQRPEGMVPGEGACGLWMAPTLGDDGMAATALHRICRGTGDAVASTRAAARQHAVLMTQALEIAGVAPDAITWVISDADQHRRRSAEAAAAAAETCPDLDIAQRYRALAALSGEIGIVMPLALLAIGAGASAAAQAPLLAFSMAGTCPRACVLGPTHRIVSPADAAPSAAT